MTVNKNDNAFHGGIGWGSSKELDFTNAAPQ